MVTDNELRIVVVKDGLTKRMLCPHCDHLLPLLEVTECDECDDDTGEIRTRYVEDEDDLAELLDEGDSEDNSDGDGI